ncbi:MAG: hypothetical protein ACRDP1_09965 [Nocardioidaceae bacterium]
MPLSARLPTVAQLRHVLEESLGRDVALRSSAPALVGASTTSLGVYVGERLATRGIVVAELGAVAVLGAAQARVPPLVAAEAIKSRFVPPPVSDGFGALLLALGELFDPADSPPGRLYTYLRPGQDRPPDVLAAASRIGRRLDVTVVPSGYASGRLSLVPVS